jgi:hypothetical protein
MQSGLAHFAAPVVLLEWPQLLSCRGASCDLLGEGALRPPGSTTQAPDPTYATNSRSSLSAAMALVSKPRTIRYTANTISCTAIGRNAASATPSSTP